MAALGIWRGPYLQVPAIHISGATMTIDWHSDHTFWSASRAEHAIVGAFELVAFDIPTGKGIVGWEIFAGPDLTTLVGKGDAATFGQAKADAKAAFRAARDAVASTRKLSRHRQEGVR